MVGVLAKEARHGGTLGHDPEIHLQKVAQEEIDEATDAVMHASHEARDFREHRLAGQKRWREFPEPIDGPAMVVIGPYQECDQRAGIDDDLTHRSPPCGGRRETDRAAPTG